MSWYQSDLQYTPSEPYIPPTWADGTDEEIVEALEKHYAGEVDLHDYWAVGDERTVSLSAMSAMSPLTDTHAAQNVVFVLSNAGGKTLADGTTECAFQVDQKDCLNEKGVMYVYTDTSVYSWKGTQRRTWCNSIYKNAIPSTLRGIFKEFINPTVDSNTRTTENLIDTFALRSEQEVLSYCEYSYSGSLPEGSFVEWYETTSNMRKSVNGSTSISWWERSFHKYYSGYYCIIYAGSPSNSGATYEQGLAPFGVI